MRTLGSLVLAVLGAHAFRHATDLVVGAMLRDYPPTVYPPFGLWIAVTALAFLIALALRGRAWTVWTPCVVFAGLATRGAYLEGTARNWIVAVVLLGQAILFWWVMRPTSPRAQTSQ